MGKLPQSFWYLTDPAQWKEKGQGVYLQALQFVLPPQPDAPEVGDGEQVDGGIGGKERGKDSNVQGVHVLDFS